MKTFTKILSAAFFALLLLAGNFAQAQSCPQTFSSPYTETFDGFPISTSFSCSALQTLPAPSGWVNSSADDGDWIVETGATGSSNTGPSGDTTTAGGTGNYLYIETSGCAGDTAILESPCFDVNGLACPGMEFYYHMFGATMGDFFVDVSFDNGVTWTNRFALSGDQGDKWQSAIIDLSGPSSTAKVRFRGIKGSSFTSDLAIDQVTVDDFNGVTFNAAFAGLPATASVLDPDLTLVPAETGGTFSGPGVFGNTWSPGAAGPGTHVITYTIGPGACATSTSQSVTVSGISCTNTFNMPYVEDFESYSTCATTCGTVCPIGGGWINNGNDNNEWLTDQGGTPTSGTGPDGVDANPGTSTGNYLYVESSSPCNVGPAILTGPCFNVTGTCPVFSFQYHKDGTSQSTSALTLETSVDGGNTWTQATSITGDFGTDWQTELVDFSGFTGSTVRVRFLATITGTSADMAIDDIRLTDLSTADPTFTGLPATLSTFDSPVTLTPVTPGGTFSGPGVTGNQFSPAAAGIGTHVVTYTLSFGSNTACQLTSTETITVTGLQCGTVSSFPYAEDFETFSTCTPTCGVACPVSNGWINTPGDDVDWTTDQGGTTSGSTGPTTDFNPGSSTGNYMYIETSSPCAVGEVAELLSPCVNIPTTATCPVFSFGYHMYGATMGTLNVDISTDGGTTWTQIFTESGDQGDQWLSRIIDLSAYAGQDVRFRFQGIIGTSFTSDMAIDDIRVYDFTGANASFDIVHPNGTNPLFLTVLDPPATLTPSTPGGVFSITPATTALNGNILDPSQAPALVLYTITYTIGPPSCGATFSRNLFISNLICGTNVVSLPYTENFDGFATCGTGCGTTCPLSGGWLNDPNDDMDWTTDAAGTGSTGTGPSGDNTTGNGNYLYTETSGTACNNAEANALSPCIDLTGASCPFAQFAYHQFGAAQGTMFMDVSTDQGNTWTNEFSSTGDQGDQWNTALVDLSAYSGTIRLRFRSLTGTTFTSDMAIDDVSVIDLANADPSFTGLPGTGCTSDSPFTLNPATPGGTFSVSPSTPALSGNTFDPALAGPGSYSITYTTPGPSNCAQTSLPFPVTILPPPTVTASGDQTICAGESATISASSSNCPNPGQVFFTASLPAQNLTSTGQNMNFQFTGPFPTPTGNAIVTVNFRGDYDLGGTESIDLIGEGGVNLGNTGAGSGQCLAIIDQADIEIPIGLLNSWIADGVLDLIADNGTGVNSGLCSTPQDVSLDIRYPAGGCGLLWSTGEVASSITVTPDQTETYFVTVIDSSGCQAMDEVTVFVIPSPTVDAGEDPDEICQGECVDLIGFGSPFGAGGNGGANSITTTFANNNGAGGTMFEVTAGPQPVTITGLESNWTSATADAEVFFKSGTYIGFETNASAWTSVGRSGVFNTNGSGNPTLFPISFSVIIPAGQTYSFYVHSHTGSLGYTNGTTEGNLFVTDGNVSIFEGIGLSSGAPFGTSRFSPRVWNGNLLYNLPGQGGGTPTVSYLWTEGSPTGPVVGTTDSIQVCPGDTTTYFLTVTDSAGCSSTDEVTVTVNPNPDLSFNITDASCFGFDDGAIDMTIAGQTANQGNPGDLTSTFAGGNGQAGNMFDVVALNDVTIDGMDIHIGGTSSETVEIYTKSGSYVGFTGSAAAWTLIGTVTVTGQGLGNPTPLPAGSFTPVTVNAGNTQAFYVTLTTSTNIDYTNGTNLGGVFASNSDIQILEGVGNSYPFGGTFSPRVWNGTLRYNSGPRFTQLWTSAAGDSLTTDEDLDNLSTGTYCVTVTDERTGCTTDSCVFVDEPALVTATVDCCADTFTCSGESVVLPVDLGGDGPWTFTYTDGTNTFSVSTGTSPGFITVAPTATTTYSLVSVQSDLTGCDGVVCGKATVGVNECFVPCSGSSSGSGSGSNDQDGPDMEDLDSGSLSSDDNSVCESPCADLCINADVLSTSMDANGCRTVTLEFTCDALCFASSGSSSDGEYAPSASGSGSSDDMDEYLASSGSGNSTRLPEFVDISVPCGVVDSIWVTLPPVQGSGSGSGSSDDIDEYLASSSSGSGPSVPPVIQTEIISNDSITGLTGVRVYLVPSCGSSSGSGNANFSSFQVSYRVCPDAGTCVNNFCDPLVAFAKRRKRNEYCIQYEEANNGGSSKVARSESEDEVGNAPARVAAYPNPFSDMITFELQLFNNASTRIAITDIHGRMINVIEAGELTTGTHKLQWDARTAQGQTCADGIYFASVSMGEQHEVIKIILSR